MRVLVIGTNAVRHMSEDEVVKSYSWHDVKKIESFGEYDRVVLVCDRLPEPQATDVHGIKDVLSSENISRILLYGGDITVLGDPTTPILDRALDDPIQKRSTSFTRLSVAELLGLSVRRERAPGSGGKLKSVNQTPSTLDGYRSYASLVDKWEYVYETIKTDKGLFNHAVTEMRIPGIHRYALKVTQIPLLENRFQAWIASVVGLSATKYTKTVEGKEVENGIHQFGKIVCLPVLRGNPDESILTLLREAWGIRAVAIAPAWTERLVAPGQEKADLAIQDAHETLRQVTRRLNDLVLEREEVRKPLRLLYAMHTELEEAVSTALTQLGATKLDHGPANRSDGLFRVEIKGASRYFAVEVKGRSGVTFNQMGIRQLNDWVAEAEDLVQDNVKGVFIGNSDVTSRPSDRKNPFESSFLKAAERRCFSVLTSETLYKVLESQMLGAGVSNIFFEQLFEGNGRLDISHILNDSSRLP